VNTACGRALDLDVVAVTKIAAMLEQATENRPVPPPRAASGLAVARFARDPREYRPTPRLQWLQVIDGDSTDEQGQEGLW
jgi:hypothetical protein